MQSDTEARKPMESDTETEKAVASRTVINEEEELSNGHFDRQYLNTDMKPAASFEPETRNAEQTL
jgi:hypothetical protein